MAVRRSMGVVGEEVGEVVGEEVEVVGEVVGEVMVGEEEVMVGVLVVLGEAPGQIGKEGAGAHIDSKFRSGCLL